MLKEIELFIGENKVEFNAPPEILYTYQVDDLTNPTIVKNSFSKTVEIEGTPNNNKIFGQYWSVERLQGDGGDNAGISFNASKKAPFTLYVDSEIYESGYVKLDEVNMVSNAITYSITLYGGLGDFFYNLKVDSNGDQRKLSDLDFLDGGTDEFDFTINGDTVKEAWDSLANGTDNKWQTINFMPAYNGLPSDFDADKVVLNLAGTSLKKTAADDNKNYTSKNGYALGTLPSEMTEWEMRDIRSYLQRPCLRMKKVIEACCNPDNNGGYEVELDTDFFNEDNPYWEKTWLSLPMIEDLEYTTDEQKVEGSTLTPEATSGSVDSYMYQPLVFSLGEFSTGIYSSISIKAIIKAYSGGKHTSSVWFWNKKGDTYHTGYDLFGSLFVQLIALNGDEVVGASNAYNLTTPVRHNGKLYFGHNDKYESGKKFSPYMGKPIYDILGSFYSDGFRKENGTEAHPITFTIYNLNTNITSLKLVYYWGCNKSKRKKHRRNSLFDKSEQSSWATYSLGTHDVAMGDMNMNIKSSNIYAVMGESMGRTGTEVTKALLLNTEESPADFLLSYTKMFGLYYLKDVTSNKVSILTRKTFYDRNRNNIKDLSSLLDRSKDYTITPLAFDTKWYQFVQEKDETQFSQSYLSSKGVEYGCKILDTGYEFSADKKDLLEDNSILSGVEGLEKSKYFICYNNDKVFRPWFKMGLKYELYNGEDSYEVTPTVKSNGTPMGINESMKYYDTFPKVQFHDEDNSPTDGKNCLVFFSGMKSLTEGRTNPIYYYLTDDNQYQTLLNEGQPCWLFTTSETDFAKRLTTIPVFERYLTNQESGKVLKSLDFGSPQDLFIPTYSLTDDVNIYTYYWKSYLTDLYDTNTRVLKCWVLIKGKPNNEWLRRFYWFDNTLWRINKITDWNVSSYEPTEVEFVKVEDINNYTSESQEPSKNFSLTADRYVASWEGDTITLHLTISQGASWHFSKNDGLVLSKTNGTDSADIKATFSQNTTGKQKFFTIGAYDDTNNLSAYITIRQGFQNEKTLSVDPSNIICDASGGTFYIDVIWTNQGDDYIDSAYWSTESGFIPLSVDYTSLRDENKVKVTVSANTQTITRHNAITLANRYQNLTAKIGVDIVPSSVPFSKRPSAPEKIELEYNKDIKDIDAPDWIDVEDDGNGNISIQPKENYYEKENIGEVTIETEDGQKVTVEVVQEKGEKPGKQNEDGLVSPTSLYYDASGGTQFVNIQIPNAWMALTTVDAWYTLSATKGDSASIMGVTASENTGDTRTATVVITDRVSSSSYTVTITQIGASSVQSLTVSPESQTIEKEGGTYTLSLTYLNRNGDYVSASADSSITLSQISWTGDNGTITVTIPQNEKDAKVYNIVTFEATVGTVYSTFIQDPSEEKASVDRDSITPPSTGGTESVTVVSNVNWYGETDSTWISFTPTSGTDGSYSLVITTEKNPLVEARVGHIYIYSSESKTLLNTITITQDALTEYITLSPTSITFDATGGTATFRISSNTSWTIEEQ